MILLTGGTGFLGREILARLLYQRPFERIGLLIRPSGQHSAESRARSLLSEIFTPEEAGVLMRRIEVVQGDVAEEAFGLGSTEFTALAERTHEIFHCAATTTLNHDLENARRINVGGTQQVLRLSEGASRSFGHNFKLFYVSTAYVAGSRKGIVRADELSVEGPFRNAYERSKAEAEAMVRSAQGALPICIFRPSIIVGDSVTGQTSAFNVIYVPAKLMVKGLLSRFPGCPNAPFDLVPVDYAADAIVFLSGAENFAGACYHISSGVGREPSLWEIIEILFATFNEQRKRGRSLLNLPQLITPDMMSLAQSSLSAAKSSVKVIEKLVGESINSFRQTMPFIPYMLGNPQFDNCETLRAIGSALPHPPVFRSYAERLFQYCLDTNWGKIPWTNPRNFSVWRERVELSGTAHLHSA